MRSANPNPRNITPRPGVFLASILVASVFALATWAQGDKEASDKPSDKTAAGSKAAEGTKPAESKWQSLFDGKTMGKWTASDFAGHGEPVVEDGLLKLPFGEQLTGVTYTGDIPKNNYEVELEAQKVDGSDFFCGLTFPVDDSFASLIVGGWGGAVVGISSFDGNDANHNETRSVHRFERGKWYKIRLRVLPDKLQAWINDEKVVDVVTTGKKISTRREIDAGKPFGIASYQTSAALRDIRIRTLTPPDVPDKNAPAKK